MTALDPLATIRAALNAIDPGRDALWATITPDTPIDTLGLDSVRLMELINTIEDDIGTTFPDEAIPKVKRVSDLLALIRST